MVDLSVVVLSFNTKELLRECLESIYRSLPEDFFEIIVVDNASSDGSTDMIKKEFPAVKLKISDRNLGFAKGINLGASIAGGNYVLFLNSDAKLHDDNVTDVVEYMEKDEKIGIIGGLLVNEDGSAQRTFGSFYSLPQVAKMLIGGDKAEMGFTHLQKELIATDWVSGGFMIVRKSLFKKLEGFDEEFFMYIEDMEFCYRVKKLGFAVYIYPEAKAVHIKQGSSSRTFAVTHIYKGLTYFYKKHKSLPELFLLRTLLAVKAILLIIFGTITSNAYLKDTYVKAIKMIA